MRFIECTRVEEEEYDTWQDCGVVLIDPCSVEMVQETDTHEGVKAFDIFLGGGQCVTVKGDIREFQTMVELYHTGLTPETFVVTRGIVLDDIEDAHAKFCSIKCPECQKDVPMKENCEGVVCGVCECGTMVVQASSEEEVEQAVDLLTEGSGGS